MKAVRAGRASALACAAWLLAASVPAGEIASDEVARTFERGRVAYLSAGSVTTTSIAAAWPTLQALKAGTFRATIVYLHGCDGINAISLDTADLLAAAGYLVLLPDSFARRDKPVSCDARAVRGGLHRDVLAWRQAEASWAIGQAKSLPAVKAAPIFLYGLSEGAIATATYRGEPLRGRVIEAWTCHAGWPEYVGSNAEPGEAVLALTSQNDPWFQEPALRGDCGDVIGPATSLRRSVVFGPPHPAASQHDLMWNADARREIFDFLAAASRTLP
jgi:dienelactone hydrolase